MTGESGTVLLIQFARAPVVGKVKTRMLPHLSAEQACELHCELAEWTTRQLLLFEEGELELAVAGDTSHALFSRCRALGVTRVSQQCGENLGQRMYHALRGGLVEFESVILVGSDCPEIDVAYLRQAVEALQHADVVLGPATDGGYVLIGARAISAALFEGIPWGSDQVYASTLAALADTALSCAQLRPLNDIDRPEDLHRWHALNEARPIRR